MLARVSTYRNNVRRPVGWGTISHRATLSTHMHSRLMQSLPSLMCGSPDTQHVIFMPAGQRRKDHRRFLSKLLMTKAQSSPSLFCSHFVGWS